MEELDIRINIVFGWCDDDARKDCVRVKPFHYTRKTQDLVQTLKSNIDKALDENHSIVLTRTFLSCSASMDNTNNNITRQQCENIIRTAFALIKNYIWDFDKKYSNDNKIYVLQLRNKLNGRNIGWFKSIRLAYRNLMLNGDAFHFQNDYEYAIIEEVKEGIFPIDDETLCLFFIFDKNKGTYSEITRPKFFEGLVELLLNKIIL